MKDYSSLYSRDFFAHWEAFADRITGAFRHQEAGAVDRPMATKQAQFAIASMAVAQLLKDMGQSDTAAHFHELAEALQDVVDGINHPLFKVETECPKRGRQHDTSRVWAVRSSLCIAVEFMIAGGTSQDEAVTYVVRKYRKDFSRLLRPGTDLKSSLLTWLKTFSTCATTNEVALDAYKAGISELKLIKGMAGDSYPKSDLKQLGQQLVAVAADRARDTIKV